MGASSQKVDETEPGNSLDFNGRVAANLKGGETSETEEKRLAGGFLRVDDSGFLGGPGRWLGLYWFGHYSGFNPVAFGGRGFGGFWALYANGRITGDCLGKSISCLLDC